MSSLSQIKQKFEAFRSKNPDRQGKSLRYPEDLQMMIVSGKEAGSSYGELSEAAGLSEGGISKIIARHKAGATRRRPGRPSTSDLMAAKNASKAGKSARLGAPPRLPQKPVGKTVAPTAAKTVKKLGRPPLNKSVKLASKPAKPAKPASKPAAKLAPKQDHAKKEVHETVHAPMATPHTVGKDDITVRVVRGQNPNEYMLQGSAKDLAKLIGQIAG